MIKKGDRGNKVKDIQNQLNEIQGAGLIVDGIFGNKTKAAVSFFQKNNNITPTGVVDLYTQQQINDTYKKIKKGWWKFNRRFVVFVDAGHGGIDDDKKYVTYPSKFYQHPDNNLHFKDYYYEGFENRIVAEMFIEQLTKVGIMAIRTYHPYKDTPLSERIDIVKSWLRRGYYGYMHSFHSNAISNKYSKEKKDETTGGIVFTKRGWTLSDLIADIHIKSLQEKFGDWVWTKNKDIGHNDWEANFKILRETDTKEFENIFGAFLEEFGFHTSEPDTEFIIKNRRPRALAALNTAQKVRNNLKLWVDI